MMFLQKCWSTLLNVLRYLLCNSYKTRHTVASSVLPWILVVGFWFGFNKKARKLEKSVEILDVCYGNGTVQQSVLF